MSAALDVEPRWLSLVLAILAAHAPRPCRVWAFGSRVSGRARRFSDLALDAGRPLTLGEAAVLADAFDESDLPWPVDVADLRSCSERFLRVVEARAVPLPIPRSSPRALPARRGSASLRVGRGGARARHGRWRSYPAPTARAASA